MEKIDWLNIIEQVMEKLNIYSGKDDEKISTTSIDRIFYDLDKRLEFHSKSDEFSESFVLSLIEQCKVLSMKADSRLKNLKEIKFMSDTDFYCFLRLKKISSHLQSFKQRCEGTIVQ